MLKKVRTFGAAALVVGLMTMTAGPAAAAGKGGTSYCGTDRWVSARTESNGFTTHSYGNGQVFSWYLSGTTAQKYSSSTMHQGSWSLNTNGTMNLAWSTGLCLT